MSLPHLDPSKPEDMRKLVASGLIWNPAVPARYKQMAVDALAEGSVEPSASTPSDVLNEVNTLRGRMGLPPLELPGVGGEDPSV